MSSSRTTPSWSPAASPHSRPLSSSTVPISSAEPRVSLSRRSACRILLGLPFLQVSLSGCTQTLSDSEADSQVPGGALPFARRTLEDIVGPNVASLRQLYGREIHQVEF